MKLGGSLGNVPQKNGREGNRIVVGVPSPTYPHPCNRFFTFTVEVVFEVFKNLLQDLTVDFCQRGKLF
jgi:hypothetical protein